MVAGLWLMANSHIPADDYANDFLNISISPAVSAQGNSSIAAPIDPFSAYYNPALLHSIPPGISLSHTEFFSGLYRFDAIGCKLPIKSEPIGILLLRAGIDHIPDTRGALIDLNQNGILDPGEYLDESKIRYFSNQDYALYGSYSLLYKDIQWGINLKWLYRRLAESRGYGLGLDIGAYLNRTRWSVGINLKDITTTVISWNSGETEYTHPRIAVGGRYDLGEPFLFFHPAVYADVTFFTHDMDRAALITTSLIDFGFTWGLSVDYRKMITFRLGFDSSQCDNRVNLNDYLSKTITTGMGIHWKQYGIQYAFLRHLYLSNTHRIAIEYCF